MNEANDYLRTIIDAADEVGWMVIDFSARTPGYVRLLGEHQDEVEIRTEHGIGITEHIRRLKPTKTARVPA